MLSFRHAISNSLQRSRAMLTNYTFVLGVRQSSSQNTAECVENPAEIVAKAHTKCRYKRLIKAAVRENGPFREHNPRLSQLIEESKKHDLSEESIDFSVKITLDSRAVIGLHEITFPGKTFLTLQYEIVDKSFIEYAIMNACEPYNASLLIGESRRLHYFDSKGIIVVSHKMNGDVLTNADRDAILALGSESVTQEVDRNGRLLMQIYCDASYLHKVKRNVQDRGYVVEEAYVGLVPKFIPELPRTAIANLANLLLDLSEIPEVDRLFTNVS